MPPFKNREIRWGVQFDRASGGRDRVSVMALLRGREARGGCLDWYTHLLCPEDPSRHYAHEPCSILVRCIVTRNEGAVKWLLRHPKVGNINDMAYRWYMPPVAVACLCSTPHPSIIRALVASPRVDPNRTFSPGFPFQPPLYAVFSEGRYDMAELLLGSNHLLVTDFTHRTAVHHYSAKAGTEYNLLGFIDHLSRERARGHWRGENHLLAGRCKRLVMRYRLDPEGTRREMQRKYDLPPRSDEVFFAAVVLTCDDYLGLDTGAPDGLRRFWRVVCRLPQPLQMQACCRTTGRTKLLTAREVGHAAHYLFRYA